MVLKRLKVGNRPQGLALVKGGRSGRVARPAPAVVGARSGLSPICTSTRPARPRALDCRVPISSSGSPTTAWAPADRRRHPGRNWLRISRYPRRPDRRGSSFRFRLRSGIRYFERRTGAAERHPPRPRARALSAPEIPGIGPVLRQHRRRLCVHEQAEPPAICRAGSSPTTGQARSPSTSTGPDPQFLLYKLALDFAVAVPAWHPRPPGSGRELPATGPYVIESGRSPGKLN